MIVKNIILKQGELGSKMKKHANKLEIKKYRNKLQIKQVDSSLSENQALIS